MKLDVWPWPWWHKHKIRNNTKLCTDAHVPTLRYGQYLSQARVQPYHPGSGSYVQLFRTYWGSSTWHSYDNIMSGGPRVYPSLPRREQSTPLYGENLPRVEESLAHLSCPGRATFFLGFLKKLANRLHEKQKVGSASRASLSSYEHFGSTSQVNSRLSDRQSGRARALFSALDWCRGVHFWRPSFFRLI